MTWDELSPEQKHDIKEAYLIRLADEGRFIEVVYGDGVGEERGPSSGELADADRLVSDDVMRDQEVDYAPEDCPSSSPTDLRLFTPEFVHEWCNQKLLTSRYRKRIGPVYGRAIPTGIRWARQMVQGLCDRFAKGQLTEDECRLLSQEVT
jgi:hypothetical protein